MVDTLVFIVAALICLTGALGVVLAEMKESVAQDA